VLPWKKSAIARRKDETVRPIFWANRPHSYAHRTTTWDEFPNGRWGDMRSPAFGDLSDYHLCSFKTGSAVERRRLWGESPEQYQDVYDTFVAYIEGRVPRLPWSEDPVQLETVPLGKRLARLNRAGFLTINSQPRVNGAPSEDSAVGWGAPGGYVYQKAYIEFFVAPEMLRRLRDAFAAFPSLTYHAVNAAGESFSNVPADKSGVNAVTWGVFPCREVLQPTVVDPLSFNVWKDEAFALWGSQWQASYEPGTGAHKLIQNIRDTFFIVNVVDNDYVKGDIFAVFDRVIDIMEAEAGAAAAGASQ
jgi:methylenetetrahydrofolate reductase (NADPH)